jgi:hypothetical protein
MRMPSRLYAAALGLLAVGRAWPDAPPAASDPVRAEIARSPVLPSPDSGRAVARSEARAAAYREHAPLAYFSLGSLAVGGVFYAIGNGAGGSRPALSASDRRQLATTVSVAGASALLAAGSYLYFVHKAKERSEEDAGWEASIGGAPDGAGGLSVSARVSLPLPSGR